MAKPLIDTDFYGTYQGDFLVLPDKNHADMDYRRRYFSRSNLAALEAAGFTHMAIELPPRVQPLFEQLRKNEISAQTFLDAVTDPGSGVTFSHGSQRDNAMLYIDLIDHANMSGVRLTCADTKEATDDLFHKVSSNYIRRFGEEKGIDVSMFLKELKVGGSRAEYEKLVGSLPYGEQWNGWVDLHKDELRSDIVKERLAMDYTVAERIKREAHGEKTAIVYGIEHFKHDRGIGNYLGDFAILNPDTGKFRAFHAETPSVGEQIVEFFGSGPPTPNKLSVEDGTHHKPAAPARLEPVQP
jgi:hypothetical protein